MIKVIVPKRLLTFAINRQGSVFWSKIKCASITIILNGLISHSDRNEVLEGNAVYLVGLERHAAPMKLNGY